MRAAALLLVGALAGCGPRGAPATDDDAIVVVRSEVDDAALWVDGRYIGPVGSLQGGVAVEPGLHRIELRHDDYFSYYQELELAAKERRKLVVELAPVLP